MTEITNQAEDLTLTQALKLIAQELTVQSRHLHLNFEKDHPNGYHNSTHVATTIQAANLLIDSATRDSDPFNLKLQLDQHNHEHQTDFNLDDFSHICRTAFSLHDTGNICQVSQTGQPRYLSYYTASGAEVRSQSNATNLLNLNSTFRSLPHEHQSNVLSFINYLIGHTIYQEINLDQPFVSFAKVCDQIGTICFVKAKERLKLQMGLINESQAENPQWQLDDPSFLFNFVYHRFPSLVPDDQLRQAILYIWQVSMPPLLSPDQISSLINPPGQP